MFYHLDVHTEYSLLNSIFKLNDIKSACNDMGFDGIGVNDFNTMHKAYTFQNICKKGSIPIKRAQGIKFLVKGMFEDTYYTLLLYAKSTKGYKNLVKLSTIANSGNKEVAHLCYSDFERYSEDLICLSGGNTGELFALILKDDAENAYTFAKWCKDTFKEFYVELVNHSIKDEKTVNKSSLLRGIVETFDFPTVACNEVFYWKKEHAEHRNLGISMNPNPEDLDYTSHYVAWSNEFYLKSEKEMKKAFKDILPIYTDCFKNTEVIFNKCKDLEIVPEKVLPEFPIPDGYTNVSYFKKLVYEGFEKRFKDVLKTQEEIDAYKERLNYEVDTIIKMGFVDYHMIVQDFINWAKDGEVCKHPEIYFPKKYFPDYSKLQEFCYKKDFPIIMGPGRGSAAGSLVCYCLYITDRDPIANKLLFERFLNIERISMPDIDVDVPNAYRGLVVQYLQNKYGFSQVSQIATFQTLKVRSILKNVGKQLGIAYSVTDEWSKNVPSTILVSKTKSDGTVEEVEKPVELVSELRNIEYFKEKLLKEEDMVNVFRYAEVLEGLPISTGKHAAGCVICSRPIDDVVPLMEVEGVMVTQCEKHDVEDLGLLKMDLLGLLNLDIISKTFSLIKEYQGVSLSIDKIPENDPKTFELFQRGDTANVFQFDGFGMRNLLKRIKPTNNEHLNAACALYRPGPMQFIDDYIAGRQNPSKINYPHESFKEVTEDTFGILVYQEQIMMLVQKMAGFSLGEADILRRGIGKKEEKLLLENRKKFVEGGIKTSHLSEEKLNEIYDIICKFASYGFNRSHSCAYAWISYLCGYLKAHYPVEYMAAILTLYSKKTEKLAATISEVKNMKIPLLPPVFGESQKDFSIETLEDGTRAIRFSYNAIRGVGDDIAEVLASLQGAGSFMELITSMPPAILKKDVVCNLINSGVFDEYGTRKGLNSFYAAYTDDIKLMAKLNKNKIPMFMPLEYSTPDDYFTEYSSIDRVNKERHCLECSLSGHPVESVRNIIGVKENLLNYINRDIELNQKQTVKILGMLKNPRNIKTKKHDDMMTCMIEDEVWHVDGVMFPKFFKKQKDNIIEDVPVLLTGYFQFEFDDAIQEEKVSFVIQTIEKIKTSSATVYIQAFPGLDKMLDKLKRHNGVSKVCIIDLENCSIKKEDFFVDLNAEAKAILSKANTICKIVNNTN